MPTIVFLCFFLGGPLDILDVQVGVHKIFPLHIRFKYLNLIFLVYVALLNENMIFGAYFVFGRELSMLLPCNNFLYMWQSIFKGV